MAKLQINIIEAISTSNIEADELTFYIVIDCAYGEHYEKISSRLNNVDYYEVQSDIYPGNKLTRINFKLRKNLRNYTSHTVFKKELKARGADRIGLLSEVTKIIANHGVDITASGSRLETIDNKKYFNINLDLYGDIDSERWINLKKEVRYIQDDLGKSLKVFLK